ncbi:unnamed protein product [Clonostachys rhizophaga]|uniref:Uncharacterized protein n=1 Tax=Clonostachys rhizophaga TaxID=160324 RepID=A0A9N9VKE3_9HYPO|nr:unnamed protein product [Clonostachys rhizophaga]
MAEGQLAYHDNGAEPFKSAVCLVGDGAPDLLMHRHDMVIAVVGNGEEKTQALHLQNIREDTLSEAKTAIGRFLDNYESLEDGGSIQNTVFQNFARVCDQLNKVAEDIEHGVEQVELELINIQTDSFEYPKRVKDTTPGNFNPVCEMIAACSEFRDLVDSIMSKACDNACDYRPERDGEIWMANSYPFHQYLRKYLGEQAESRDLTFYWETRVNKSSSEQRTFHVPFQDDPEWDGWIYL